MKDRPLNLLELLDRAGPSLHVLLTRLTLRQDVAEELMQELFIRLHNSRSFIRTAKPSAYAFRTAVNLAMDWRRRKKKTQSLDEHLLPADPAGLHFAHTAGLGRADPPRRPALH